MTARKILLKSGLAVSLRTVQKVLQETQYMVYGHLKVHPALNSLHVKARKDWAAKYAFVIAKEWKKLVFSDEKRFSLDVPDG